MSATLLKARRTDFAIFINDQQNQCLTFQTLGNGCCRVEEATFIEFFDLTFYFVLPTFNAAGARVLLGNLRFGCFFRRCGLLWCSLFRHHQWRLCRHWPKLCFNRCGLGWRWRRGCDFIEQRRKMQQKRQGECQY